MERLKWILIAGGSVWTMVLGGLIMFVFGYRGYDIDPDSIGQHLGGVITAAGVCWFIVIMVVKVVAWFSK